MTYEESSVLMNDMTFRGRIKVSCLKFAAYVMDEAANVPGHTARLRWSQGAFQTPDMVAAQVQSPVVMTPEVQTAGANIDDGALQVAVESVVNKFI